jgi:hypothetical protein
MEKIWCAIVHEHVVPIAEDANLSAPCLVVIERDKPSLLHMAWLIFLLFQRQGNDICHDLPLELF